MTSRPDDVRAADVRGSEARVWAHWGVKPAERILKVGSPARRIRVTDTGSGPPVLFVHGTAGYGPYWGPLVANLGGYRSLLLDRPGWGGSDPVDYSQSNYRDFVADLMVDVLDALGVGKVHAVGASIGDNWALALASKHPDRVHSVAFLGGGPLTDDVKVPPGIRLLRSPMGVLMSRIRWREKMETGQARHSGNGPALDDGRIPQLHVDWKVAMTNASTWRVNERAMVRAITSRQGWKPGLTFNAHELGAISVPVLMIYGADDPIADIETWQSFVDRIPNGSLEVIEHAGHLPWFDHPEQVSGLLKGHFQAAAA